LPCNHFTPHLSREEIASYIGSAHETVIRCISEFKELGYINEENKTFYILNKEMLLNLSGGQLTH
jgi:CRP-like cAMP-binding protein